VRQRVSAQVAIAAENLPARVALVGLVVGVREQVRLQVGALVEGARAHRTPVRRRLLVQNAVHGQGARLAETLAALRASERLLLRVDVSEEQNGSCQFSHLPHS